MDRKRWVATEAVKIHFDYDLPARQAIEEAVRLWDVKGEIESGLMDYINTTKKGEVENVK